MVNVSAINDTIVDLQKSSCALKLEKIQCFRNTKFLSQRLTNYDRENGNNRI